MSEPGYRRDARAIGSPNYGGQERAFHEATHRKPTCSRCLKEITDGGGTYRCAECADKTTKEWLEERREALDEATPAHFRWAHKDAPELAQRIKPVTAITQAFDAIKAPTIVLMGPAGSGKTSLGRAVWFERRMRAIKPASREWSDRPVGFDAYSNPEAPTPAAFATTFDVAKARREHKLGEGDAEIIRDASRSVLLLLDELGSEAGRGDTAVSEIIHSRHAHDRPTIYTTPFTLAELKNRYGDGIARRIFEGATVVKLGA